MYRITLYVHCIITIKRYNALSLAEFKRFIRAYKITCTGGEKTNASTSVTDHKATRREKCVSSSRYSVT